MGCAWRRSSTPGRRRSRAAPLQRGPAGSCPRRPPLAEPTVEEQHGQVALARGGATDCSGGGAGLVVGLGAFPDLGLFDLGSLRHALTGDLVLDGLLVERPGGVRSRESLLDTVPSAGVLQGVLGGQL